jgi:hypothetical protein
VSLPSLANLDYARFKIRFTVFVIYRLSEPGDDHIDPKMDIYNAAVDVIKDRLRVDFIPVVNEPIKIDTAGAEQILIK